MNELTSYEAARKFNMNFEALSSEYKGKVAAIQNEYLSELAVLNDKDITGMRFRIWKKYSDRLSIARDYYRESVHDAWSEYQWTVENG